MVIVWGLIDAAVARTCSMSGSPATRCRTFGRADFIRVPLPAARITTCNSMLNRLSRGSALQRAFEGRTRRGRRRFERRTKRIVAAQRFEIGIGTRQRAVLGVQGDGPFEMRDGFSRLVALRVRDGKHVQRVVVVGIFVADQSEMAN